MTAFNFDSKQYQSAFLARIREESENIKKAYIEKAVEDFRATLSARLGYFTAEFFEQQADMGNIRRFGVEVVDLQRGGAVEAEA